MIEKLAAAVLRAADDEGVALDVQQSEALVSAMLHASYEATPTMTAAAARIHFSDSEDDLKSLTPYEAGVIFSAMVAAALGKEYPMEDASV